MSLDKNNLINILLENYPKYDNDGANIWKNRSISFLIPLIDYLYELRDKINIEIDTNVINYYIDLNNILKLILKNKNLNLKSESALEKYFLNLPGFKKENLINLHNLFAGTRENHLYVTIQLKKPLEYLLIYEKNNKLLKLVYNNKVEKNKLKKI